MAVPPAPRALLALALALTLALALGLGLGAAFSSASLSTSRPRVPVASSSSASLSTSRDVPHPGGAVRLQRTPKPDTVLALSASPVGRHFVALAFVPARRRLLADPVHSQEAHGAGDPAAVAAPAAPAAGSDAGRAVSLPPPRATLSGAGAAETFDKAEALEITGDASTGPGYGWESLSPSPPQPGAAALLQPTPENILALPTSPSSHEAEGPAAYPAPAASPAASDAGREVPLPPLATTCSFVTYIGGEGVAAETVQRGNGRVFVVHQFTGSINGSDAAAATSTNGYGLESASDDEDTDDDFDDDSDAGGSDSEVDDGFAPYMADFCAFVRYVRDAFDVVKAFA